MKPNRKTHRSYKRWLLAAAVTANVGTIALAQDSADEDEEVFELSPFEVDGSENDIGYHSENTLMGTRLNSNIGDLAASITLVTAQQMEDTGSLDINDIFLYEANTEGAHNYSAYHVNRGYLKDEASGISQDNGTVYSHATSNRVRGLGAADTSQNNYPTISRIPFDTYNTNSVEINRGPNSMLFGMGSPAGIINQTTASASIGHTGSKIGLRVDSFGGWRANFSHNKTLIEDKLAVFVAGLHDERGFERKPSYDETDRQYISFKYKPHENTTFRASFENYENESRRPNTIAPRESITPWMDAGRPVWDGNRNMIVYLDSGKEVGPYTRDSTADRPADANLNNPDGAFYYGDNDWWRTDSAMFIGMVGPMSGRPTLFVEPDGTVNTWELSVWRDRPDVPAADSPDYDPYWKTRSSWMMSTFLPGVGPWVPQLPGGGAASSPYYQPGLIDKSIYDYDNVNITAPNFQSLDSQTFNIEFDQKITEDLYFSAGWFRQEADSLENNPISNTSPTTVNLDVSMYLLDGSPNPNYLSPYIDDYRADVFTHPENNNNIRAQLAYQFDFSKSDNWTKWFGEHQAMALYSKNTRNRYATRSRIAFYDEPNGDYYFAHDPATRDLGYSLGANNSAIRRYYYLGSDAKVNAGNVGIGGAGSLENWGTGGITDLNINTFFFTNPAGGEWRNTPVEIGTALWWPSTNRQMVEVDSNNIALQSRFWDGKIVTTIGFREDEYFAESYGGDRLPTDNNPGPGYENGHPIGGASHYFNTSLGTESLKGSTSTKGVVFKATDKISFTYNESDNFNPPNGNSTDFYGNLLPKPTGEGKDYGVRFQLLENKLHASINWFETSSKYARGVPGVFVDRTQRIDYSFMHSWADKVVRIRAGEDPTDENFANNEINPRTTAQDQEIWNMIGLSEGFQNGVSVQGTQDTTAEGMEFQVVYNPANNWTMKFTAGKQETVFTNVAPQWEPWASEREAVWTSATAPDMDESYTLFSGRELSLRSFWNGHGYKGGDIVPNHQWGWNTTADYYRLTVTDEIATIRNKEGQIVPGQREWRANFLTNYVISDGKFKGLGLGGSARWEEAGSIGNYGIVGSDGVMRQPDINRPIYGDSEFHVDLWASYSMPIGDDKNLKLQLNIRDALEDGGPQGIAANFDGSVYGYRFVDPRQFVFTSTLEF